MKTTTKRPAKSPPKVRARREVTARLMWGESYPNNVPPCVGWDKKENERMTPFFVLPGTPEAVEQMIEQGAKAIHADSGSPHKWEALAESGLKSYALKQARAMLASLGLAP